MHARTGIAVAFAIALAACEAPSTDSAHAQQANAQSAPLKELSVADVALLIQAKAATVVDANNADTRAQQGVVPGAVLLTSSHDYSLSELPAAKDTKLVFYCGGTMCRASDGAAKRAAQAGYADVSVMRAGIRGWRAAGQTVQTPNS